MKKKTKILGEKRDKKRLKFEGKEIRKRINLGFAPLASHPLKRGLYTPISRTQVS